MSRIGEIEAGLGKYVVGQTLCRKPETERQQHRKTQNTGKKKKKTSWKRKKEQKKNKEGKKKTYIHIRNKKHRKKIAKIRYS